MSFTAEQQQLVRTALEAVGAADIGKARAVIQPAAQFLGELARADDRLVVVDFYVRCEGADLSSAHRRLEGPPPVCVECSGRTHPWRCRALVWQLSLRVYLADLRIRFVAFKQTPSCTS